MWGYNAVLCAMASGGMFFVLTPAVVILCVACAATGALFTPIVAAGLSPIAVPAMTLPFCFAVLI